MTICRYVESCYDESCFVDFLLFSPLTYQPAKSKIAPYSFSHGRTVRHTSYSLLLTSFPPFGRGRGGFYFTCTSRKVISPYAGSRPALRTMSCPWFWEMMKFLKVVATPRRGSLSST